MTTPPDFGVKGSEIEETAQSAVPILPTDPEALAKRNRGRLVDPDNAAHAPGRICELCGTVITASQDARLEPDGRWIHEACPVAQEELYSAG
jgi:hypothetical protein